MLEDGGHRIISKIVTGDETYIPFYDIQTRQESCVWIHEDDPTPMTPKRHGAVKKVTYAVFFRSTGLVKAIKLKVKGQLLLIGTPENVYLRLLKNAM